MLVLNGLATVPHHEGRVPPGNRPRGCLCNWSPHLRGLSNAPEVRPIAHGSRQYPDAMSASDDVWAGYYAAVEGRPVRPLFVRALQEFGEVRPGFKAVDLGCGGGTESRALLDLGFTVTAIDSSEAAVARLSAFPEAGSALVVRQAPLEEVEIPKSDLIYAGLSLPFCRPDSFASLWSRVLGALRPGGLLACDLFGVRDDWAVDTDLTFVTRDQVLTMVAGLGLRSLHEIEEEGASYAGPKHWHTFQVVARAMTHRDR